MTQKSAEEILKSFKPGFECDHFIFEELVSVVTQYGEAQYKAGVEASAKIALPYDNGWVIA